MVLEMHCASIDPNQFELLGAQRAQPPHSLSSFAKNDDNLYHFMKSGICDPRFKSESTEDITSIRHSLR